MLEILIICVLVVAAHWALYWYLKREHRRAQGFYKWYDKEILRELRVELLMREFSQGAELLPVSGKTIKWRRYCSKSE